MLTWPENLRYDPDTGLFWRRYSYGWKTTGNDVEYKTIEIGRVSYHASRLAFLYMTGKMPEGHMDHIDGDTSNDRWSNLREATPSQNCHNSKRPSTNTSGIKGVSWNENRKKWQVLIRVKSKLKYFGCYTSKKKAKAVAGEARHKLHKLHREFANAG